jgi:hypothetical protein
MLGLTIMDAKTESRGSLSGSYRGRSRVRCLSRVVIIGLGLWLGLSSTLGNSPQQTSRGGSRQRQRGNGAGVKVARPPRPRPAASVIEPEKTGWCRVPIRNSYEPDEWQQQQECIFLRDQRTWLVSVYNSGNVPVFVNEWYGVSRHGETAIRPKETKLLPLWGYGRVWIGACWPGPGGQGTCQAGQENQTADVFIGNWVNGTYRHELWFRDHNQVDVPREEGFNVVATNETEFPIQLRWTEGPIDWVTIPPKGRSQPIPFRSGRTVLGKKDFGTGAAARVTFTRTGGEEDETYLLINPGSGPGSPPVATMTWLFGSWCGVRLENIGSTSVILNTWMFPGFPVPPQTGPGLSLRAGQSDTLQMGRGTFEITGQVGIGAPGIFTRLRATNWRKCP